MENIFKLVEKFKAIFFSFLIGVAFGYAWAYMALTR